MKYSKEFEDKWGFADGTDIPPDAEKVRELTILAVNRFAESLGSGQRMIATGNASHNPFMIDFYQAAGALGATADELASGDYPIDPEYLIGFGQCDELFDQAYLMAEDLQLAHEYLTVEVKVDMDRFDEDVKAVIARDIRGELSDH